MPYKYLEDVSIADVAFEATGRTLDDMFESAGLAVTNVMVKDGVTVVIAGLIKDEKRKDSAGIPFVSQLPILGPLLSSKREFIVKTETVIFLTPYIITGDADSSNKTKQYDLEKKEPKELKLIK